MIITPNDLRKVSYCVKGSKLFAERYGLDFNKFLRQGISEEELLATGDYMAKRIVDEVRKRRELDGK